MHKPNFCCECGERVVRTRWRAWTSRRFCASCERRFRRERLTKTLLLAASLVVAGFLLGRLVRPPLPPLVVEHGALGLAPLPVPDASRQSDAQRQADAQRAGGAATKREPAYGADGTANERPTEPDEVVYICGARTKKGTPCQRRVRGPGRCWQHRGMPAMLPPSKLVVPG
jgi:hypothetical protein